MLRFYVEDSALLTDEGSPFQANCTWGDPRLTVIVGENASGKSLLARAICSKAKQHHDMVPVSVSIRERTESGMRRAFMFGEEEQHSTGGVSAGTVVTAFKQKYDKPWLLMLDEPEMGMSEGYAGALGEFIGELSKGPHENLCGVLVVTHSRPLVRGLIARFPAAPTFVWMSVTDEPIETGDIDFWLKTPDVKTIDQFMALRKVSLDRFRQVNEFLKRND